MTALEDVEPYHVLSSLLAQRLFGRVQQEQQPPPETPQSPQDWLDSLIRRTEAHVKGAADAGDACSEIVSIGSAALQAFLQANVTGPPLTWKPQELILPNAPIQQPGTWKLHLLKASLSIDGEAVYHLLPHVELFALSKCLLNHPLLKQTDELLRWRLRVNTWHQRLLNALSPTVQDLIYRDMELLEANKNADLFIERASIHILHGFEAKARLDLSHAANLRHFEYALTGRLGKRTKYQEKELSQLLVLAKSADETNLTTTVDESRAMGIHKAGPKSLDLKDDTLLEAIYFTEPNDSAVDSGLDDALPASLKTLDPGKQPLLEPLDSIILLAIASSITNTNPQDGLTREETLPYAERVITSGSSNWQVYTQALLVRSRIEGYKTRTTERGLLQLQALVDQVIAETAPTSAADGSPAENGTPESPSTFLPKAKQSESAPASERLLYIHQLASPPRWELEAELADRWVSLGGLRTALEIYERLHMWAEVALCWAANDREDKARKIIRRQLYNSVVMTSTNKLLEDEGDTEVGDYGLERDPLPADAPRLFCILGDLEKSPSAYERAWVISSQRFARAQRSLGKYYMANNVPVRADEAYTKALKVNPQNHPTWFALGCLRLQLETWSDAVDAFSRAVQIDDTDAESWSNLAVSLLKLSERLGSEATHEETQGRIRDSFVALKRAATLKRESFRIWQNLLSVSVKLEPPPYTDIVIAQSRLIDLLGTVDGEKCVDIPVMEALLADVISTSEDMRASASTANGDLGPNSTDEDGQRPRLGLEKMVIDLIRKKVAPLITSSRRLWLLTAKLSLHLHQPQAALTAYEKAWRSQINKPGWDTALMSESKVLWREVADATIDLIDAYESLGERSREAGLGKGETVAKDWRFKARSAARSVLARANGAWEVDDAYGKLNARLQDLKAG
ncbi:MAG: hypothetical protein Q9217_002105 [Psora testacea]